MKVFFAGFLLIAAVAAANIQPRELCNAGNDHNLVDGCNPPPNAGNILSRKSIVVPARFLQVNTHTYKYPEAGAGGDIIGCIRVTDKVENGRGGCPSIISGGSGFHDVTLQFISQRSREMKFLVEIYKR